MTKRSKWEDMEIAGVSIFFFSSRPSEISSSLRQRLKELGNLFVFKSKRVWGTNIQSLPDSEKIGKGRRLKRKEIDADMAYIPFRVGACCELKRGQTALILCSSENLASERKQFGNQRAKPAILCRFSQSNLHQGAINVFLGELEDVNLSNYFAIVYTREGRDFGIATKIKTELEKRVKLTIFLQEPLPFITVFNTRKIR